jgi:Zn-finger in ubiquitin-hydrolases and other protein
MPCAHLDTIEVTELPDAVAGCEECLAAGADWCHLRICLGCGHVGCCDSSPGRHATQHATLTGHPIMRSIQPGETWSWCYVDEVVLEVPEIRGQSRIPPSPLCP